MTEAPPNRGDAEFGIAATRDQRADAVAFLQAGGGERLRIAIDDFARDLQARDVGSAGRHGVVPHALQHVRTVHAAGRDANQQLRASVDSMRAELAPLRDDAQRDRLARMTRRPPLFLLKRW